MAQPNRPHDLDALSKILGRHSRVIDAAAEAGMSPKALTDTFRKRGRSASAQLARVVVPEGMRVRQVTSRTDESGAVLGQSIKADLETKDPPRFEPVPPDFAIKGLSTYLGPQGEQRGQWVIADQAKADRTAKFWAACEAATLRYRGIAARAAEPKKTLKNTLTAYLLGDPHIGMLAWGKETGVDFDTRIAERELFAVVADLVARTHPSEIAILADLGDFVHAQSDKNLTPNGGNKLDVDGRIAKVNETAFNLKRRMIDLALTKHRRVRVVIVPGNHDPDTARMLALWLRAVYENEPRVEILPNWNPYTYVEFGNNLLGFAHGDGAKVEALPAIMAVDMREAWGRTACHDWHTGHRHHLETKEFPGAVVYTHRTVAPSDGWHHWKGYRSGKSLMACMYAKSGGMISTEIADLGLARDRILARVKSR